jgi:hypothetical protein
MQKEINVQVDTGCGSHEQNCTGSDSLLIFPVLSPCTNYELTRLHHRSI